MTLIPYGESVHGVEISPFNNFEHLEMHPDCLFLIGIPHPGGIGYVDRLCSFHKVTQNHLIKTRMPFGSLPALATQDGEKTDGFNRT